MFNICKYLYIYSKYLILFIFYKEVYILYLLLLEN